MGHVRHQRTPLHWARHYWTNYQQRFAAQNKWRFYARGSNYERYTFDDYLAVMQQRAALSARLLHQCIREPTNYYTSTPLVTILYPHPGIGGIVAHSMLRIFTCACPYRAPPVTPFYMRPASRSPCRV